MTQLLLSGPENARITLVFAHGAGAPMDSDWMNRLAAAMAAKGVRMARFEFGYMAARRTGQSKPPPKAERLESEYLATVEAAVPLASGGIVLVGGKSLGGRVASMVADRLHADGKVGGLICAGYPFHPPGDPAKLRTAHLARLACPAIIFQGERDPFGTREEIATYELSPRIAIDWMIDGDHDLKPRKASGLSLAAHMETVAARVADWSVNA